MRALLVCLSLWGALSLTPAIEDLDISVQAQFLKRSELPDDIDFPLLELGFQVLRVDLHNRSTAGWTVPSTIQLYNPRNKPQKVLSPAEMTPKIVNSKAFRARQRSAKTGPLVNVPIYPRPGEYGRYPQGRAAGPAMIQVGAAEEVRTVLERHQLAPGELQPGETRQGLIFIKTKNKPADLLGSRLLLGSLEARTQ